MPGKTVATPDIPGSVTNGRPGFSYQWWPDVGVGKAPAPHMPPGAHWNGPNNGLTAITSRHAPVNTNSASPGNLVSKVS